MSEKKPYYIVAITGASGSIYGVRLIQVLLDNGFAVHLVISGPGRMVLAQECGIELTGDPDKDLAVVTEHLGNGEIFLHSNDDLASPIASGSSLGGDMIISPCSMGTAGRIASGVSLTLIDRSADVTLKEGRKLILLPRETPLNAIHLENLLKLSRAGAVILPPMPAFYHNPGTIQDLVDFIIGKVTDILEIPGDLFKRWE